MGQLRSALSAATHGADDPPRGAGHLDRYARTVDGAASTTVVQVRLDRVRGTVRYSRAGHLPPLVVTHDGEARFLEDAGAPPLGTLPGGARHPAADVPFPPRATLVLYTDGLIERRERSIDVGLGALTRAARRHVGLGVEDLADAILADVHDGGGASDDTALVIARSTG